MALLGAELKGLEKKDLKAKAKYIIPHKNKKSVIEVEGKKYERVMVRTHVIRIGETFDEIINTYVLKNPEYRKTDIVGIGDKVSCVLQGRIKNLEDVKISGMAKFLTKFVGKRYGNGIGNPYKMQLAIERVGALRILFAAGLSAVTRPLGIHGIFYHVAGKEIGRFDGFGGHSWYRDFGTLGPDKPNQQCDEIYNKFGVKFFIPDANDFGCNILGKGKAVEWSEELLCAILKDNPAGNFDEQTPVMFLREV
jgi:hypothetical protein